MTHDTKGSTGKTKKNPRGDLIDRLRVSKADLGTADLADILR